MTKLNEPWRDPGCICEYYGGDIDSRRSKHKDCPVHSTFPKTGLYTLPVCTKIWRKARDEDTIWHAFVTTQPCHYTHGELLHAWKLNDDAFVMQINDPDWPVIRILCVSIVPPFNFACVNCGREHGIRLACEDQNGSKWCTDCWHEGTTF